MMILNSVQINDINYTNKTIKDYNKHNRIISSRFIRKKLPIQANGTNERCSQTLDSIQYPSEFQQAFDLMQKKQLMIALNVYACLPIPRFSFSCPQPSPVGIAKVRLVSMSSEG
ncbi:hypothetical protein JTB14_020652 [Gonioctena quinquepunctata]|nr:hypothetical protein JTB14_020652 [Gonioctena quinquepunctata]